MNKYKQSYQPLNSFTKVVLAVKLRAA